MVSFELFNDPKYALLIHDVKQYYQLPHRVFHDWSHIKKGVLLAQRVSEQSEEFNWSMSQQLAWLFHDIVYIPRSESNEKQSVALMHQTFAREPHVYLAKELEPHLSLASQIIRATASHVAVNEACKSVLDIDMSCFHDSKLLKAANRDVIKEFLLPTPDGRIAFLETLLGKSLYATEYAKANWETIAQRNITNSIRQLRRGKL